MARRARKHSVGDVGALALRGLVRGSPLAVGAFFAELGEVEVPLLGYVRQNTFHAERGGQARFGTEEIRVKVYRRQSLDLLLIKPRQGICCDSIALAKVPPRASLHGK